MEKNSFVYDTQKDSLMYSKCHPHGKVHIHYIIFLCHDLLKKPNIDLNKIYNGLFD